MGSHHTALALQYDVDEAGENPSKDTKVKLLSRLVGVEEDVARKGAGSETSLTAIFNRAKKIYNYTVNIATAGTVAVLPGILGVGYLGSHGVTSQALQIAPLALPLAVMFAAAVVSRVMRGSIATELKQNAVRHRRREASA